MLLDFIGRETGTVLSETWKACPDDLRKRQNLMRGLSRIVLSLARTSLPRIGSLRFNDDGSVSLSNRPILSANLILENDGAPKMLERTYSCTGAFVSALLQFRQLIFRTQPNAVKDDEDCRLQMAHLVVMRATMSELLDLQYEGPFVLQHLDLHASNIFVDQDWNVTGVIDLESVCSLPPDMIGFSHWLAVDGIDELVEKPSEVEQIYESYAEILEEEQAELEPSNLDLAMWMRKAWKSGAYFFYLPFMSVNGFTAIVEDHILPMFDFSGLSLSQERDLNRKLSHFWSKESLGFVEAKIADKRQYDKDLEAHYRDYLDKSANSMSAEKSENL